MQSLGDDERKQVLGEVLHDELKAILELVKGIPVIRQELQQMHAEVDELKADMKLVKAAVTDLSKQSSDHERRLTRLEARAA